MGALAQQREALWAPWGRVPSPWGGQKRVGSGGESGCHFPRPLGAGALLLCSDWRREATLGVAKASPPEELGSDTQGAS